jgi:hypothetical protein
MIAPKDPFADQGTGAIAPQTEKSASPPPSSDSPLPNSKKIYVSGTIHPDIRVPFREIALAPTKTMSGEMERNEPVRVYDTSGPWGDNASPARTVTLDPGQGLPALRRDWIRDRGDVEEIEGRQVRPFDDGWLSEKHRTSNIERRTSNAEERSFDVRSSKFDVGCSMFLNILSAPSGAMD